MPFAGYAPSPKSEKNAHRSGSCAVVDGFVYVEIVGGLGTWCVAADGSKKTLCGQRVHHVPQGGAQPSHEEAAEDGVHAACLRVLVGMNAEPGPTKVRCPACGGSAEVVEGRIGPHADRGRGCVGVNLSVSVGRRR